MEPFIFAGALLFDNKKLLRKPSFEPFGRPQTARPSNRNCMAHEFFGDQFVEKRAYTNRLPKN
jgi:hypothetical protein